MKREQLHLFQEYAWENTDGVDGDGLCEGEEVYAGELLDAGEGPCSERSGGLPYDFLIPLRSAPGEEAQRRNCFEQSMERG